MTKTTSPAKKVAPAQPKKSGAQELKFLKEVLEERTMQLEQSNEQLDQFAHTSNHEFQEPLRKIITFSRILQQNDKKLSAKAVKDYLNKIEVASVRMTKIIEDMRNFASVTNYDKLYVPTDLNEILQNVLFDFELLINENKAEIVVRKLPTIEAVPFQMNQLFYEIIHNALKFSKPDVTPVIKITANKLALAKFKQHPHLNKKLLYYEITFKDNGIGFDQKYSEQIFTMFQRLSAGGNYAGTGVGLAVGKKIVQTYSGEIFAKGKEGQGATIHIILPVEQLTEIPEDMATILKTWV